MKISQKYKLPERGANRSPATACKFNKPFQQLKLLLLQKFLKSLSNEYVAESVDGKGQVTNVFIL